MAAVQLMLENPLYAVIVKEFINIFDEFRDKDRTVMDQEVKRLAEAFLWEKSEQKKGVYSKYTNRFFRGLVKLEMLNKGC